MSLTVEPQDSMYDQPVRVAVTGLHPNKPYTLSAMCQPYKGIENPLKKGINPDSMFLSFAHYLSNGNGVIDVLKMPSCGGTYSGVEPMGLVWSMQPCVDATGHAPNLNVLHYPPENFRIAFLVFDDHATSVEAVVTLLAEKKAIAQQWVIRRSVSPTTRRIVVRQGRLRGALFVPEGKGPFPAIIDIVGAQTILMDIRAATLASYGFVTFTLVYLEYEGLPNIANLELEYFLEALKWFDSLPEVDSERGIGIFGDCIGGVYAMYMAIENPKVKAVATINSCSYLNGGQLKYKGKLLPVYLEMDKVKTISDDNGTELIVVKETCPVIEKLVVPIEQSLDTHFLFIAGDDDMGISWEHSECLLRRLQRQGARDGRFVLYKGAGHLIRVPNTPFLRAELSPVISKTDKVLFGGKASENAHAQEASQAELVQFFSRHLQRPQDANCCTTAKL